MSVIIGFTYDVKSEAAMREPSRHDCEAEFDAQETIDFIRAAIESAGHTVVPIGNARSLLERLPDLGVDVVFNICEGRDNRNREAQVPILLEMHGIPYIGSDGLTMSVALDKIMAKKVLIADGIPTPRYLGIDTLDDLTDLDHMAFPMIVKLRQEGCSKGLDDTSVVHDRRELDARAAYLWQRYNKSPLLVEQFIAGRECTVPLIGNESAWPLPIVQLSIRDKLDLGEMIYTFERIFTSELQYICPAKISQRLGEQLRDLAWRTCKAVGARDFARVDFRIDNNDHPYVLEINPLPSLATDDVFAVASQAAASDYKTAIGKIINAGLQRLGLH